MFDRLRRTASILNPIGRPSFAEKQIQNFEQQVPTLISVWENCVQCQESFLDARDLQLIGDNEQLVFLIGFVDGMWRHEMLLLQQQGQTFTEDYVGGLAIRDVQYLILRTFRDRIRNEDDFSRWFGKAQASVRNGDLIDWQTSASDFSYEWYQSSGVRTSGSFLDEAYKILRDD